MTIYACSRAAMTFSSVALCSSESAAKMSAGGVVVCPYLKASMLTATQSATLSPPHPCASTTAATGLAGGRLEKRGNFERDWLRVGYEHLERRWPSLITWSRVPFTPATVEAPPSSSSVLHWQFFISFFGGFPLPSSCNSYR